MSGLEYLDSRVLFGMKAGLENIKALCAQLGNPQNQFPTIHVVGTNGKGSTAWYLAGILQAHGLRTGLFTSPHLVSVRERIRLDDRFIPHEELGRVLLEVRDASNEIGIEPTFFEVLTAAALYWFAQNQVQVAVLEAGLGGRLDSTNVANSQYTVLTSIALEHTEHLGNSESQILKEKLGVLRPKGELVLGALSPELQQEAQTVASELEVRVHTPLPLDGSLRLGNLGELYRHNAALSWTAAQLYLSGQFSRPTTLYALQNRSWPGRMQLLYGPQHQIHYLLDGAHNPHAAQALAQTLSQSFPGQKFPVLFAALVEKEVRPMLKYLAPHVSHWYCTRTQHPKMQDPQKLVQLCQEWGGQASVVELDTHPSTLLRSLRLAHQGPLLVTGSLYLVGAAVGALRDHYEELRAFRELEFFSNEVK